MLRKRKVLINSRFYSGVGKSKLDVIFLLLFLIIEFRKINQFDSRLKYFSVFGSSLTLNFRFKSRDDYDRIYLI